MGLISGGIGLRGIGASVAVGPFRLGAGLRYASVGRGVGALLTLAIWAVVLLVVVTIVVPLQVLAWSARAITTWRDAGKPSLGSLDAGDRARLVGAFVAAPVTAVWLLAWPTYVVTEMSGSPSSGGPAGGSATAATASASGAGGAVGGLVPVPPTPGTLTAPPAPPGEPTASEPPEPSSTGSDVVSEVAQPVAVVDEAVVAVPSPRPTPSPLPAERQDEVHGGNALPSTVDGLDPSTGVVDLLPGGGGDGAVEGAVLLTADDLMYIEVRRWLDGAEAAQAVESIRAELQARYEFAYAEEFPGGWCDAVAYPQPHLECAAVVGDRAVLLSTADSSNASMAGAVSTAGIIRGWLAASR